MIWSRRFLLAGLFLLAFPAIYRFSISQDAQQGEYDWRDDWAVQDGFVVELDTEGFHLPTAIAFIPNPGPDPKDPLYFVAELRGKVKVVTNDRSIYTFAEDFFYLVPQAELPEIEGETGMAGICLAPEQGYVFVTFAYQDEHKVLRNNIVRFQAEPVTFSHKPTGRLDFTEVFASDEVAPSHQIGSCAVNAGQLYVSVADGRQQEQSQNVHSLLGKVLRMSLDGKPLPDNPFYQDGIQGAASYVWALGFRNPFGLTVVDGRVFLADNGHDVDRFVEVEAGENYLWDGNDWSIGAKASAVLSPSVGPVRVVFTPSGSSYFPEEYERTFLIAASAPELAGIIALPYSLDNQQVLATPEYLLKYRGGMYQSIVGLDFGPDGLYFVPLMPDATGVSAVYKITYDPGQDYPNRMARNPDPIALMREKGCFGCHSLNGSGGNAGPALDRKPLIQRLRTRLNSAAYLASLSELDGIDREPFRGFREARSLVRSTEGRERIRTWMKYHIVEPRFDNPNAQMPNLGLSEAEAALITDYLLGEEETLLQKGAGVLQRLAPLQPSRLHLAVYFAGGFFSSTLFLLTLGWVYRKRKTRTPHTQETMAEQSTKNEKRGS